MSGRPKILVVDDQPSFRDALSTECDLLGYEPLTASDGNQAFELYKDNEVALILSDIRMPENDGQDLLKRIRQKSTVHVPFVFLSGFSDVNLSEALDHGADGYLHKPVTSESLSQMIEELTSSLEKRLSMKKSLNAKTTIAFVEERPGSIGIGRRGFFAESATCNGFECLKNDELVNFQLHIPSLFSNKLDGCGKVLWKRIENLPGLKSGIGIQFEYLEENSRNSLIKYINEATPRASVPKGVRNNKVA